MSYPIPERERERQASLDRLGIIDTAEEKVIDNLTELAATICDVPISLVSLIDKDRQWFKSRFGLDAIETPREDAFCAHAVVQDDIFVIEDATRDKRFANNNLVKGDPKIRFYAGAPLSIDDGLNIGTLCVIDTKPRELTATQRKALGVLRDTVAAQFELRRARMEVEALERIVPMCAWCRKIRTGEDAKTDSWIGADEFVMRHSKTSHGICPTCEHSFERQDP